MISVETYLSFMNYDGAGSRGFPFWIAHPVQTIAIYPSPIAMSEHVPEKVRKLRQKHWGLSVQKKFNAWIVGRTDAAPDYGYSLDELKAHLERQFSAGMCWSNYAGNQPYRTKRRTWVVDHIVPKRLFDLEHVGDAYALTNLRPMWFKDNIRKGSKRHHLI